MTKMCMLIDCGVFFEEGVSPKDLKCSCGYGYRNILQDCFVDYRDRPDPNSPTIPRKAQALIARAEKNAQKFEAYIRAQFVLHAASCGLRRQIWLNEPDAAFDEPTLLRGFAEVVDAHRGNYANRGQTELMAIPASRESGIRGSSLSAAPRTTLSDQRVPQRSDVQPVDRLQTRVLTSVDSNIVVPVYSSSPRLSSGVLSDVARRPGESRQRETHVQPSQVGRGTEHRSPPEDRTLSKPQRSGSITDRHDRTTSAPRAIPGRHARQVRPANPADEEPDDNDRDSDLETERRTRELHGSRQYTSTTNDPSQSQSPLLQKFLAYSTEALDSIASFVKANPQILNERPDQLQLMIRNALQRNQKEEGERLAQRLGMLTLSRQKDKVSKQVEWFESLARSRKARNELDELVEKILNMLGSRASDRRR